MVSTGTAQEAPGGYTLSEKQINAAQSTMHINPAMQALVAVGSNENAQTNIARLLARLRATGDPALVNISRVYRTEAVNTQDDLGKSHGGSYLNAALVLETSLSPAQLKEWLRRIEDELGRRRNGSDKTGAVAIDLDLILVHDPLQPSLESNTPVLPHPDLLRFAHVAVPCADVAPDWIHPTEHRTLRAIADGFTNTEMEIVSL